jgi:PAS domain-containing protein
MLLAMEPSGGGQPSNSAAERASRSGESALADERYRAIVKNLPKSVVILCDPDMRFTLVDGAEVEATGFS